MSSTLIHQCLKDDVCLKVQENSMMPYSCKKGYSGNLCTVCAKEGDDWYARTGDQACSKCLNPAFNAFRILCYFLI